MLPQHLIIEFWLKVQNILERDYSLNKREIQRGISDYVALSEKHGFTDMIYHQEAEDVAKTIAASITQGGFREPAPSTVSESSVS